MDSAAAIAHGSGVTASVSELSTLNTVCTLGIFIGTLALILVRPRGWSDGWWAALGAVAMIALRLVTPDQALEVVWVSRNAILFLLALLLLSALLESSGFFEWAALHASRRAGGNGRRLFRNVFLLGALVTTVLSLDTTAVMLTPIVVVFVRRLRLPALPYVIATAFVANIASLMLPISNLTNLLFADAFHIPFGRFALRMVAPQLVAIVATYLLLRWCFRNELPSRFDAQSLAEPSSVVIDRRYFRVGAIVLVLVLVGYFVGPVVQVEPYVVAFGGAFMLGLFGAWRRRVGLRMFREVSWGLFPLVLGLFVVVRGVENLGIVATASRLVSGTTGSSLGHVLIASGTAGAASNVMNNLPAALLARSALQAADGADAGVFGALLGLDIGPTILPTGSLATLLVLGIARKKGVCVRGIDMIKVGWWVTPIVLLLASITLAAATSAIDRVRHVETPLSCICGAPTSRRSATR
jgi:arsenical pump membrane protein